MIRQSPVAIVLAVSLSTASWADTRDEDHVISPKERRELSFTIAGMVEEVLVKRGDMVKQGDILIKLEAHEQEAIIKKSELDLKNQDLRIKAAKKNVELAKVDYDRKKQMVEKRAGTDFEMKSAEVMLELRRLEEQLTQATVEEIKLELDRQKAIGNRFSLRAPITGRIEDVTVSKGETVEMLKPVVLLIVTDPLKIEANVAIEHALTLKKGDKAWVTPKLPGFTEPMLGKITFVAEEAKFASKTLTVEIEVLNPKGLKAGTSGTVAFTDPNHVITAKSKATD